MWALVTMDSLDDHRLVLGVENLATSTLHGICSVIGVLYTGSQVTSNLQKKEKFGFRLFSFVFVFFVFLFFLSLLASLIGAAALLAAGCQRVVRHLRSAGQAAERV